MELEKLHELLTYGKNHNASDVHFRPGAPPMFRIGGRLLMLKSDLLSADDTESIAKLILGDRERETNPSKIKECDTGYSLDGVSRFRVNIYRQRGSIGIVLRIIPDQIPTMEMLGLPPVIGKIADAERGLILVTGATGSGKTSTLASIIDQINRTKNVHILTIEDPIEFLHKNIKASVSQREIGPDTENYVHGLRSALRQDPDVIFVGEMRDAESIDIALKASETGHLVLSTVHTTDAPKTIGRLTSVFPAEEQLSVRNRIADNLRATISQRLLPRSDQKGRAVALEIMINTITVQEYIRDMDRTDRLRDVIAKGRKEHEMQTFDQHLTDLYKAKMISLETAIQASTNPSDFQRALHFE